MENINEFIQKNSPDGGFLQSLEWRRFQEAEGHRAFNITSPQPSPYKGEREFGFWANVVEHQLPIVGKYFYVPRGPIIPNPKSEILKFLNEIINLAKKENAGWIRIEPASEEILELIKKNIKYKIIHKL